MDLTGHLLAIIMCVVLTLDACHTIVVLAQPGYAHYHLGTLYEGEGLHADAMRHYAAAKTLLKGKRPQRRLGLTRRSSPPPMSS